MSIHCFFTSGGPHVMVDIFSMCIELQPCLALSDGVKGWSNRCLFNISQDYFM